MSLRKKLVDEYNNRVAEGEKTLKDWDSSKKAAINEFGKQEFYRIRVGIKSEIRNEKEIANDVLEKCNLPLIK